MAAIEEAVEKATKFVKEKLNTAEARLVSAVRGESGWEIEIEVYEESAFIKALGLPTRVLDRNIYLVRLDDQMDVQSYEREGATAR